MNQLEDTAAMASTAARAEEMSGETSTASFTLGLSTEIQELCPAILATLTILDELVADLDADVE